jgi:hypothetical protein
LRGHAVGTSSGSANGSRWAKSRASQSPGSRRGRSRRGPDSAGVGPRRLPGIVPLLVLLAQLLRGRDERFEGYRGLTSDAGGAGRTGRLLRPWLSCDRGARGGRGPAPNATREAVSSHNAVLMGRVRGLLVVLRSMRPNLLGLAP